ncbi:MBL fold metallo-hydrolase [Psychrobacillus sp. NEAU-3TGS]|uniref:MBL fold metallo-hydrolase n=1 Tax=Psychrobacillus sp. NEAU-3TGS TaxID=2995412 RepID=UPI002495B726|nr:MBL fold metallo-hydrolase [Psychrobacillus sp. NEAU-3TGS]MDI2589171.1 MBL fold metallo-hydrolase [Psychrobacillus sp. NEAU-3TGS]
MVLVKDELSILIDTGFGSDVKETERLIREAGVSPEELNLIVNTHYHSDHVGDSEACSAEWLDHPVEPYQVDRKLSNNEEIYTGSRTLQVLHTPGHTLGHISLYEPEEKNFNLWGSLS